MSTWQQIYKIEKGLEECRLKKHWTMKTVRMSIEPLIPYAEEDPNLKIIHLIRDPRAIENSIRTLSSAHKNKYSGPARVCDRLAQNIQQGYSVFD